MWSSRLGAARAIGHRIRPRGCWRAYSFERTLTAPRVLTPTRSVHSRLAAPSVSVLSQHSSVLNQFHSFSTSTSRSTSQTPNPVVLQNASKVLNSQGAQSPPVDPFTSPGEDPAPKKKPSKKQAQSTSQRKAVRRKPTVGATSSTSSSRAAKPNGTSKATATSKPTVAKKVRGPQAIPAKLIDARAIAGGLPRTGGRVHRSSSDKGVMGYVKMLQKFPRLAAVKIYQFFKATLRILTSPSELREKSKNLWSGIKHEAKRFYHGTRLLISDVNAAMSIASRRVRGHQLSRREYKQLTRTIADIFRMVPFSIMILVPFLEFLLPVALAVFPNMLPSTFQEKHKEAEKVKKQLALRLDLAKFVVDTLGDMATDMNTKDPDKAESAKNLAKLLDKVRAGEVIDNDSLINVAKLFEDDITIDSLSREQLQEMCRYMGLRPYGSDIWLRTHLLRKFREIKSDDISISVEGVESLTPEEVTVACRDRGMKATGLSEFQQRRNLESWLDLSLNHQLPPSLLILSRPFTMAQRYYDPESSTRDAGSMIAKTIASLDEGAVDEVRVEKMFVADVSKEREVLLRKAELIAEERSETEKEKKREEEAKAAQAVEEGEDPDEQAAEQAAADKEKKEATSKDEAKRIISEALSDITSDSAVTREKEELEELRVVQEKLHAEIEAKKVLEEAQEAAEAAAAEAEEAEKTEQIEAAPTTEALAKELEKAEELVDTAEPIVTPASEEIKIPKSEELPLEEPEKTEEELEHEEAASKKDEKALTKSVDRLEKRLSKMLDDIQKEVAEADEKIGDKLSILKDKKDGLSYDECMKLIESEMNVKMSREELSDVIEKMDRKHDGVIDPDELKATVAEIMKIEGIDAASETAEECAKESEAKPESAETQEEEKK